ncbi:Transcriptional regulatory protein BasR [Salmonella enterica subsp. diarizonae]|uniref:Transcriptional regulatory protein BasR n=1 Tax=Salmonella diarizonae TaxID=59204 RepID=A0A379U580_SALDZ|nr:Transcriptional regulatory protein BasR [Salmonella enterica subsp. diarizonae]
MKILIVEDDTLLLQGLILAAQTEGYACDGVSTARAAEHSLESGHYSLMVLDLGLPDEDGLHFLTRVRQKKIYPAGTHSDRPRYAQRPYYRAGCRRR